MAEETMIPIESLDIRAVYRMEIFGQRIDRQAKQDPRITKIRRKLAESLKSRRELVEPHKGERACLQL